MSKRDVNLCTAFDSNYLDKGIVLYQSLEAVCENFTLYVFAFDERTKEILMLLSYKNMVVISLKDFETEELREVKSKRSKGEYCWTCTPIVIQHVLTNYKVEDCTYIDSDLFFYQSPMVLLKEFYASNCSVGLVKHRFPNTERGRNNEKSSGTYCVQFNTFKNDKDATKLLEIWKQQCLFECSIKKGGDQYYITDWGRLYDQVYEYQNNGAGVAPWNLANYKLKKSGTKIELKYLNENQEIVFYHFQGIQYSQEGQVNINVITAPGGGFIEKKLINYLYYPYLKKIELVREMLMQDYQIHNFNDGCNRNFKSVKFNFFRFFHSFVRRMVKESLYSAIEFLFRVIKKKYDIIELREVRK